MPIALPALLAFAAALAQSPVPAGAPGPVVTPPRQAVQSLLFWDQATRDANFRKMETVSPTHVIKRGPKVHRLDPGKPLGPVAWTHEGKPQTLDGYMADEHVAGLMVLQDGRVRFEKYGLGMTAQDHWTSFSVAKSLTSTLVGAAVKDGLIRSVEDPITAYLPELKGSGYDGVTVRQVLTMTSGVKWNEDYTDPKSDVAVSGSGAAPAGWDPVLWQMSRLPSEAKPGTKWVYKTGETNLIGVLVTRVTGKTLAQYASEKIWKPYGMEQDGYWMHLPNGQDFGGCCINLTLHDYARIGQFVLDGAPGVVPPGWLEVATHKQADIGVPNAGYGYQWWTQDDGTFAARGIFGQLIHIDPKRKLLIVINASWPTATGPARSLARYELIKAVTAAVDAG